jgi:CRISPR system Cascade subunit CasC
MPTQPYKTFIELHLIQNFPPANLNRDDSGSPKDCEFGGYRRARISSQALKRSIRHHPRFAKMTEVDNGTRSKWLTRPIVKALKENYAKDDVEATEAAKVFVENYAAGLDGREPKKTNVLVFFSPSEVVQIVSSLVENWDVFINFSQEEERIRAAKEAAQKAGKKVSGTNEYAKQVKSIIDKFTKSIGERTSAPDIALFGRMLAGKTELNIDAACQVSHAISTHRVTMEMDYYTAVDELLQDEEAGAGMVGFTGFNSACFYRYYRIDLEQLVKNLNGDTKDLAGRTVIAFLRSAIDAIPTGKQNAFAAQNPTSFALAVVRRDGMCWNLANAFETPIQHKKGEGYISESITKMDALWGALARFYDDADVVALSAYDAQVNPTQLTHLENVKRATVSEWLEPIRQAIVEG